MRRIVPLPSHRRPTTPGEYIDEQFLRPQGITQQRLADALDIDRVGVNAIINGRRGVTPETALRLEKVLGPSADFWLNLQRSVDLWDALHSGAIKGIENLRPLSASRAAQRNGAKGARAKKSRR